MRWFAALALLTGSASQEADPRPNILLCMADDWGAPHASIYGDKVVKTPAFDQVAKEGVLFTRAYCATPSCTPSRAALLSGQHIHRLEQGASLYGPLLPKFKVYPDILEEQGYVVGHSGKGWGPGTFADGGRTRNPCGPKFADFESFLKKVPKGKPFCFWFGSTDPHRPYAEGSGATSGMKLEDVEVPPYLPDTPEVRGDLLDYYWEVQRFDQNVGKCLDLLEPSGRKENTIVVVTSDNGMPFPRSKTSLHDSGTWMPLALRWPAKVKGGRTVEDFVSLCDLAPTFLEAAGLEALPEMTGRTLMDLFAGESTKARDRAFFGRERHANVRKGNLSYPARAIRTKEYLYIRNFRPDRWPGGDPELHWSVGSYGDTDNGPTKEVVISRKDEPAIARYFELAFAKRPAEELYDVAKDPHQIRNVAGQPEYAEARKRLRAELDRWLGETGDPRLTSDDDRWDAYPYSGGPARKE